MKDPTPLIKALRDAGHETSIVPVLPMPVHLSNGLGKDLYELLVSINKVGHLLDRYPKTFDELMGYHIYDDSESIHSLNESIKSCINDANDAEERAMLELSLNKCRELMSHLDIILSFPNLHLSRKDTIKTVINAVSFSDLSKAEMDHLTDIAKQIDSISKSLNKDNGNKGVQPVLSELVAPSIIVVAIVLFLIVRNSFCTSGGCNFCICNIAAFFFSLAVAIVIMGFCMNWKKHVDKKQEKYREQEIKERDDLVRRELDVFDIQLSIYKHRLRQLDLQEDIDKTILDEYVRDKDHCRKMELREQERIAGISDKIIELGKIKNIKKTQKLDSDNKLADVLSTEETSILSCND